ncbi:hypothetical protein PO909_003833 [Leuciscus waleckii]
MELNVSSNSTSNNTAVGSEQITPAVVLGLCCLVGLPSNIAVIVSIVREWNKNLSFTLSLMLNLAVSDALTLCLAPVVLCGILFGWKLGLWSCRILFFLGHWNLYVAVLTVTSMSVHRYHNVIKSRVTNRKLLYRLERRHRRHHLTGIWILAFVFALPIFFTQELKDKDGLQRCQRTMESRSVVVAVLLLETLFGFIIPFLIMLTCYLWLHNGLSQKAKSSSLTKRLVVSIVLTFFLFWTPVYGDTSKTMALLNCCLDPFLYAVCSGNILKCIRKKL